MNELRLHHPALRSSDARRSFLLLILFRSVLFAAALLCLDFAVDVGTNPWILALASTLGVAASSRLCFSRLRTGAAFGLLIVGLGAARIFAQIAFYIPTADSEVFLFYTLFEHGCLFALIFAVASISTWLFWRFREAATVELLAIGGVALVLLSGHRDFRLDHPKVLNSLAWNFGVSPLAVVVSLGAGLTVFALLYLFMASMPSRPIASRSTPVARGIGKTNYALAAVILAGMLGVTFGVSKALFDRFMNISVSRLTNGVGMANTEEGLSPLGFHNALGSTNQPAALVRLEGDYSANPFTPMMYMREMALSRFNGHEMVIAEKTFDRETAVTTPTESFTNEEQLPAEGRVEVVQSVFLLASHDRAFAVDYPIKLTQLKNPNLARFKGSYRAYSLAPTFKIEDLRFAEVGDPTWTETERKHYTEPHTDPRYATLALQLTENAASPLEKVATIVQNLSDTSIYTLTPNHNVPQTEDQTAPFLFGDHRGYCVHFAHATVYMLRGLGIPARIGTGYMSDLSQAKDGHVLLRMSDRHAWAEVYVRNIGWVPFDTHPQQVESHADTQVDMKLLEELMGMLGPDEEVLPKSLTKGEENVDEPTAIPLPSRNQIIGTGVGLLLLVVLTKIFLLFGWLLPAAYATRIKRSYRANLTWLRDLGETRVEGETRQEFRSRIQDQLGTDPLPLTTELLKVTYAAPSKNSDGSETLRAPFAPFRSLPIGRRLLAAISPRAVFGFLMREKW